MATPARATGKRAPRLNFPVTAEMIETAIPQNSAHCMIADGLKAARPTARQVSVDLATIRFTDPVSGRRYIYLTPRAAQLALLNFDQGRQPDPFVVQADAAQIVEKKSRAKTPSETSESGVKKTRKRAKLVPNTRSGSRRVPIKEGGQAPPLGALAKGAGSNVPGIDPISGEARTGRIRRFGLKSMGH